MTVLASDLMSECADDVLDPNYEDRWDQDDWLRYLNSGETQLVYFKPSANPKTDVFVLVEGPRQSLPTSGIELVDITRNMGTDGLTPGDTIHKVDPKDLDETMPAWRSASAAATVLNFMFDPNNRKEFEVYPPQPSSGFGYIEAIYSELPTKIVKSGESYAVAINLDDEYAEALKNYMIYRALRIDAQVSDAAYRRSLDSWNLFVTQIGRKDLVETRLPAKRGKRGNTNQPVS